MNQKKRFSIVLMSGMVLAALGFVDCREAKGPARGALSAAELACVFSSSITDDAALASLCGILEPLAPLLRDLIGQREGARRAGVTWPVGDAAAGDAGGLDAGKRETGRPGAE